MANAGAYLVEEEFDPAKELKLFVKLFNTGAVASFCGLVRDLEDGRKIDAMHIEHYPGMTEKCLENIAKKIAEKHGLLGALVIHRVGTALAGEPIVMVLTASTHRREALRACEQIMDYVKTGAPLWKHVGGADGFSWIEAKTSDDEAAANWGR